MPSVLLTPQRWAARASATNAIDMMMTSIQFLLVFRLIGNFCSCYRWRANQHSPFLWYTLQHVLSNDDRSTRQPPMCMSSLWYPFARLGISGQSIALDQCNLCEMI